MNPGLVVKLRPTGPWRIGPDSGARNRVDTVYHSDTLYAAVTGALARLGPLDEWLAATARNGVPAVCFSSCFPFLEEIGFIVPPRTLWPPTSPALLSARVRWKSARFVPLGIVQAILSGHTLDENHWSVDAASECLVPAGRPGPFRTGMRSNAAVDRLSGSAERHSTACIEFRPGAGLWTIVSFADEEAAAHWLDPVKTAFRLLADSGFGGERSRGWGRSEAPEFVEGTLPEMILPAILREPVPPEPPTEAPPAEAPQPEPAPIAPAILPISVESAEAELARMASEPPAPVEEPEPEAPQAPIEEPPEEQEPSPEEPPREDPAEHAQPPAQAPGTADAPASPEAQPAPEQEAAEPVAATEPEGAPDPETPTAATLATPVSQSAPEPGQPSEPAGATEPEGASNPETPVAAPAEGSATSAPAPPVETEPETPPISAESPATTEPQPWPQADAAYGPAEAPEPQSAPEPETSPAAAPPEEPPANQSAEPSAEPSAEEPPREQAAVLAPPVIQPLVADAPAPQPVNGATHPHWLLSLFTPSPSDSVDWSRGSYSVIDRGGRIESPARSGELKKQLPMVTEGSVLFASSPPRGSAPDVAPDGFAHPVYRAGFALSIPLPEVR
jgi:CRISPR type III-A-associated RAMP protein Csm4